MNFSFKWSATVFTRNLPSHYRVFSQIAVSIKLTVSWKETVTDSLNCRKAERDGATWPEMSDVSQWVGMHTFHTLFISCSEYECDRKLSQKCMKQIIGIHEAEMNSVSKCSTVWASLLFMVCNRFHNVTIFVCQH